MKDANHTAVVLEFERLNFEVADLAYTGRGVPDLLVRAREWPRAAGSYLEYHDRPAPARGPGGRGGGGG